MMTRTNGHVLSDTPVAEIVLPAHDAPVLDAGEDRRGLAPLYLVERKHAGLQS
jgi:hypothetical protein